MKKLAILSVMILCSSTLLLSQEQKPEPPYSHKGFKAAVGVAGLQNDFDRFGGKIDQGGGGFLSLGWGFSNHVSLWLAGIYAEHPNSPVSGNGVGFGGLEIDLQHKFVTESPVQPYGKVGVGVYVIGQSGVIYSGGGLAGALGLDYFFSPHVGLGLELQFKGIGYSQRSQEINGKTVTTDVDPKLDGKANGILLTLTLQ